jgi:hypothetical protein
MTALLQHINDFKSLQLCVDCISICIIFDIGIIIIITIIFIKNFQMININNLLFVVSLFFSYTIGAVNPLRIVEEYVVNIYSSGSLEPEDIQFFQSIVEEFGIKKPIYFRAMTSRGMRSFGIRNATALFGNYVLVCPLLLKECSKDQLRFIIGHELAHLEYNHSYKKLAFIVQALLVGAIGLNKMGNVPDRIDSRAIVLYGIAYIGVQRLVSSAWVRSIELDADAAAVRRLGNGEAAMQAMEYIAHPDDSSLITKLTTSHPSKEQRIATIKAAMSA